MKEKSRNKPATGVSIPADGYPVDTDSKTPKTPKTPADEGIEFFESSSVAGQAPIRVYELKLDDDGGPNKDLSVSSVIVVILSF